MNEYNHGTYGFDTYGSNQGDNMTAIGGRNMGDAGTHDTKVQRIEEGLPAFATVENPTANPPSINTFDAGLAVGVKVRAAAQIDTQWEANGLSSQGAGVKRAAPSEW